MQRNLITLCGKCHTNFDAHRIAIHPTNLRWIITESLRAKTSPSKKKYKDIHAKPVCFSSPAYIPPAEVFIDRMTHFVEKNRQAKGKTIYYCHFCLKNITGADGCTKMMKHILVCNVTESLSKVLLQSTARWWLWWY